MLTKLSLLLFFATLYGLRAALLKSVDWQESSNNNSYTVNHSTVKTFSAVVHHDGSKKNFLATGTDPSNVPLLFDKRQVKRAAEIPASNASLDRRDHVFRFLLANASLALHRAANVTNQMPIDIFSEANKFQSSASYFTLEWLILLLTVIMLIIVDFCIIQPLAKDPTKSFLKDAAVLMSDDKERETVFKWCDVNNTGRISRKQLIALCEQCPDVAHRFNLPKESTAGAACDAFMGLGTTAEEDVTWYDFNMFLLGLRDNHSRGSFKQHLFILFFWVCIGLAFNIFVAFYRGEKPAFQWCTGYFLEWILSMDNLFVFHLVFKLYGTPKSQVHKALFVGIVGAVAFRLIGFVMLASLMHYIHYARFAFGIFLIYSGVQAANEDEDEPDVENIKVVQWLKSCLGERLLEQYDTKSDSIFVWKDGKLCVTLMFPVIMCLEFTDILFAFDSVTAKVAQIPSFYIVYSSSIIAIFGLRAMFFVIEDLVDCFTALKYGLCIILVFIGIELMIADYVNLPPQVVCIVILSVFVICVATSLANERRNRASAEASREAAVPSDPP